MHFSGGVAGQIKAGGEKRLEKMCLCDVLGSLHTACTIEETVSRLDSVVNLVGASVVVDLPQAKADEGHIIATIELDVGSRHLFETCL